LRVFFEKTKQLENGIRMQDAAPQTIGRKILKKFEGTQPCPAKKVPTIFEFPPPKSTTNSKRPKTPQKLQFSVFQKKKVRQ
jgi:hypothetical protein